MLSRFDNPAAVRGLIPLLDAEDEVRFPAARLSARFGYLPALDLVSKELCAKMNTPEALDLLSLIVFALARTCTPAVEVCVGSRLPEVRLAAVRLLAEAKSRGDHSHVRRSPVSNDEPTSGSREPRGV